MSQENESLSLRDQAWDANFFGLVLELSSKNYSRYQSQTELLLKEKSLELTIQGQRVLYELDRVGCKFSIVKGTNDLEKQSWSRIGWRKSEKKRALPRFFAKTEASLLLNK